VADAYTLGMLYRRVYGRCVDRMGKFYCEQSPAEIRADPLAGLAVAPELLDDPEAVAAIADAAEDAIAGRAPKW